MNIDKILLVDDETNVLDAIKRQLTHQYNIVTATSGNEGITQLEQEENIVVVISDLRMPGMDGIEFLSIVKKRFPDNIRVMLSGAADLNAAIKAVNHGNIFHFITKPCSSNIMVNVIDMCIKQFHLIKAERELLENASKSSIRVLVDILSLTNPVAFSRTLRIKHFVVNIVERLNLQENWMFESAALLSQLGCVTIPTTILEKAYYQKELSTEEQEMIEKHHVVAYNLIKNIPRLEPIAEIIRQQKGNGNQQQVMKPLQEREPVDAGAEILRTVLEFETMLSQGMSKGIALNKLHKQAGVMFHPSILTILRDIEVPSFEKTVIKVGIKHLHKGLIVEEDFYTINGVLLVTKGQEVTDTLRTLLENHLLQNDIKDEILVSIITRAEDNKKEEDNT